MSDKHGDGIVAGLVVATGVMSLLAGIVCGYAKRPAIKPTESTALQERIDKLQSIVNQRDGELESYRLYASKTAASLVDLNIQLRERTNECERLQRENMRLERRAMGLSGENEP